MVSTPVYGKYKKCWVLPQEKIPINGLSKGFVGTARNFCTIF